MSAVRGSFLLMVPQADLFKHLFFSEIQLFDFRCSTIYLLTHRVH